MAKIKGTGMLHCVKALRQRGARERIGEDLLPYLETTIEVDAWYPAEDFQSLLAILVSLVPDEIDDPWVWLGERTAAWDLTEIYTQAIPRGDVWGAIQRLTALWRLYYDEGEVVVTLESTSRALVELRDFSQIHPDYCRHLGGYFGQALRLAGAEHLRVELLECSPEIPLARWRVGWG